MNAAANPAATFHSYVLRSPGDFTPIVWGNLSTRAEAEAAAQRNADAAGPGTTCAVYEGAELRGRKPVFTAVAKKATTTP